MARDPNVPTLSIYIPKRKRPKRPIERLARLSKMVDRSINYLVVEAVLEYVEREEKRS
jgi:predicted DNA-binding protein